MPAAHTPARGAFQDRPAVTGAGDCRRLAEWSARLTLERLEDRWLPAPLFVSEPDGALTYLPPTDIGAAFAGILRASGRTSVVIPKLRHGFYDRTVGGAVVNAGFTPTGLVTREGSLRLPVSVQEFANYFGFDHLNWQQQMTIPDTWSAAMYPSGVPLGTTFTDPQPTRVSLVGSHGFEGVTLTTGDGSGLYWDEHGGSDGIPEWQAHFVNPLLKATEPANRAVRSKYWFEFEDTPRMIAAMYNPGDYLAFHTTLVGVRSDGSAVSLASPYGTDFSWRSNTAVTSGGLVGGGVSQICYFSTPDSAALPVATAGGIDGVSFATATGPAVLSNPSSVVVGVGATVSFATTATGIPSPAVQWQVSTDRGATFADLPGATSPTLTFTAAADQSDNLYRAVFTNPSGTATSAAAALTVATAPVVTTSPDNVVATAGNRVTQTAAAVGAPAPTVKWQVSTDGGTTFADVPGATSPSYSFAATASAAYRAVFANASGTAETAAAFVTVRDEPSDVVVAGDPVGRFPQARLIEPLAVAGQYFQQAAVLPNGNIVAVDADYSGGAGAISSAVFLYDGQSGALISTLTGTGPNVRVTVLANGNFVVLSSAPAVGGAATWGSGTTGVSGVVSAANSLVGVYQGGGGGEYVDQVVTPLANGNYVVCNPGWRNARGFAAWGDGAGGTTGPVSAANSLVGDTDRDQVGWGDYTNPGVVPLPNGNYVVKSYQWHGATGAVTWGDGTAGVRGAVSAANSLVGTAAGDSVGYGVSASSVTVLANGNYVVASPLAINREGAVTWGSGTAGVSGVVSAVNSLLWGRPLNSLRYGVTALTNGNYVVHTSDWRGVGAATWVDGTTGLTGDISAANSLVGAVPNSGVSSSLGVAGVAPLANGNYVVLSPQWGDGVGAATFGSGATGTRGVVSASNSLTGSTPDKGTVSGVVIGDRVGDGGATALANGNYVVSTLKWGGGRGAVTWANGTTGGVGAVSAANSLVGTDSTDQVGSGKVTPLVNGNYVVASPEWYFQAGAVTWGDGTAGVRGTVSAANSLVGSDIRPDRVGTGGVTALANGNYVVYSAFWNGWLGAVTWGDGSTGVRGTVSADNSLVGTAANGFLNYDQYGRAFPWPAVFSLPNGTYVVLNQGSYSSATGLFSASATWGDGASGIRGAISDANSLTRILVENTAFFTVSSLPNGDFYVLNTVGSPNTITWMSGSDGSPLDGQRTPNDQNSLPLSLNPAVTFTDPNQLTFGLGSGQTVPLTVAAVTRALAAGRDVTLRANNDLVIDTPIVVPAGAPGRLTLIAGRSILLNADVRTGGGDLVLVANAGLADGVLDPVRDPGAAAITQAAGATIDTGGGVLTVDLPADATKTNHDRGVVTLTSVAAGPITLPANAPLGVTIRGTTPGDGLAAGTYTRLTVTGALDLNGAALAVDHRAVTPRGSVFVVARATGGVTGAFAGLPDGAEVVAPDGTRFTVRYGANGGQDVALTQTSGVSVPVVTGLTPASGPAAGGTTVTISGTDLAGATAVRFGTAAAAIVSVSPTAVVVTSPPGAAGAADVTVTTAGGTSAVSPAGRFAYTAAPTVGGTATGFVIADANGNRAADPGEGMGGATVYLDLNGNAARDPGEPGAVSAADGSYSLTVTADATGWLRLVTPAGYAPAFVPGGPLQLTGGATFAGYTFGVTRATVPPAGGTARGVVFADANGNRAADPGEGQAGVTVYLDLNGDGSPGPGEPAAVTVADGSYVLSVAADTTGWVRQVVPAGYTAAVAPGGPLQLTGGRTLSALNFGNRRTSDPPANTRPTLAGLTDVSIPAGQPVPVLTLTVGDRETPAAALAVSAESSDPALVPPGGLAVGGSGAARTLTVTPVAGRTGTAVVTVRVTDSGGATATTSFRLTVTAPPVGRPPAARGFAVGSGGAGGVTLYNPDGTARQSVDPFPGFTGGVRVAAADFNGDGVLDVVAGTGPGGPSHVAVLDGATGAVLFAVDPFEAAFTGGVYVAAGDLTGDGRADLVITPDEGGGPRVRVFSGDGFGQIADFFGIDDPNFRGGARAGVGDLTGDGRADLIVSAGFGGGPRVAAFDGISLADGKFTKKPFADFFAFEDTLRNGVFVAAGDLDGDGAAELVAGAGPGGGPRVSAFDGRRLVRSNTPARTADLFAGDVANRGGVRVAVRDLDGDGKADLVAGAGAGGGSRVTAYRGTDRAALLDFEAAPGFTGGVFVG